MTASKNASLCYPVAELIANEVRRLPMGYAARMLDTSKPMIARLRAGQLSSVPILLKAIEQFGVRILEPIIGKFDDESLFRRLDAIEKLLGEVRHVRTSIPASASHRALAADGRAGGTAPRLARPEAVSVGAENENPALALVETRHDPAELAGREHEALRRHLNAFANVVSLDAARALAKADNTGRTGLAYRRPGEDWTALVAPENRLWTPSHEPRPITAYEGNVVALRRTLDEAARSPVPIFATHAGALLRGGKLMQFHSHVVRIGGRAKCGAECVVTDFVRVTA